MPRPSGIRLQWLMFKARQGARFRSSYQTRTLYSAQRVRHVARRVPITQGLLRKMLPSTRRGSELAFADTYTTGSSAREARNAIATSHPVIPAPRRISVTKISICEPPRKTSSALSPELASITVQPAASNSSTRCCRRTHSSSTTSTTRDDAGMLMNPEPRSSPKRGASCRVRTMSNSRRSFSHPTRDRILSFCQRVNPLPVPPPRLDETFSSIGRCHLVTIVTGAGFTNGAGTSDSNAAQPKGELWALPNRGL